MSNEVTWTIIGAGAALLTSFGFVPQVLKMWQRRSAGDVSIGTFFQFTAGVILWALYGVYLRDPVVITANVVTLITLIVGVSLFFRFRKAEAGGAILGALHSAQELGADTMTILRESAHALVKAVSESGGDLAFVARASVDEAVQGAQSGQVPITPEQAASAAASGALAAAREVGGEAERLVRQTISEVLAPMKVQLPAAA